MVKLTSPLFSLKAAGNLKKQIIYTSSKGIAIAKRFFKSRDPKSQAQLNRREIYAQGVNEWNNLSAGEKEIYEERAEGRALVGFNIFMREYLKSNNLPWNMALFNVGIYGIDLYYPD